MSSTRYNYKTLQHYLNSINNKISLFSHAFLHLQMTTNQIEITQKKYSNVVSEK